MIPIFLPGDIYSRLQKRKSRLRNLRSYLSYLETLKTEDVKNVSDLWYNMASAEPDEIFNLSDEDQSTARQMIGKIEDDVVKMLNDTGPVWNRLEIVLDNHGWTNDSGLSDETQWIYSNWFFLYKDAETDESIGVWIDIVLYTKELI